MSRLRGLSTWIQPIVVIVAVGWFALSGVEFEHDYGGYTVAYYRCGTTIEVSVTGRGGHTFFPRVDPNSDGNLATSTTSVGLSGVNDWGAVTGFADLSVQ